MDQNYNQLLQRVTMVSEDQNKIIPSIHSEKERNFNRLIQTDVELLLVTVIAGSSARVDKVDEDDDVADAARAE